MPLDDILLDRVWVHAIEDFVPDIKMQLAMTEF